MTDLGDNRLWTARSLSNGDLDKIAKAKAAQFRLQSNGRVESYNLGNASTMLAAIDACLSEFIGGCVR